MYLEYEVSRVKKEFELMFNRRFEQLEHNAQMKQQEVLRTANDLILLLDEKLSDKGILNQRVSVLFPLL